MKITMYGMTAFEEEQLDQLMLELDWQTKENICKIFNDWHIRLLEAKRIQTKRETIEEAIRALLDV